MVGALACSWLRRGGARARASATHGAGSGSRVVQLVRWRCGLGAAGAGAASSPIGPPAAPSLGGVACPQQQLGHRPARPTPSRP